MSSSAALQRSVFVLSAGVYLLKRERLTRSSEVLEKVLDDDQKQLEALNILQGVAEQLRHPKSESPFHPPVGGANSHTAVNNAAEGTRQPMVDPLKLDLLVT